MKFLVAVPCMDMIHTQFACALLSTPMPPNTEISFAAGSLIYDSRNKFADKVIREGFDRVLWFDSDMSFQPDLVSRLHQRLDEGLEFVTALYVTRKNPIRPCIFKTLTDVPPTADFMDDYPRDQLFEIAGCGFGGVMMTGDLLRRVTERFGRPFSPVMGVGEDLSFCLRVSKLGVKMYCDSSIKMGHIGLREYTEATYFERLQHEQKQEDDEHTQQGEG